MWWWMRWLTSEEKKTKFLVIDEVGQVGLVWFGLEGSVSRTVSQQVNQSESQLPR